MMTEEFSHPTEEIRVPLDSAGASIRLLRPRSLEPLLDDLSRQEHPNVNEEIPYWGHLWASAIGLARHLHRSEGERLDGARVLELGCGLGLVGLTAARLGARVTLSDARPETLAFAEENLRRNDLEGRVLRYDWRDPFPDAPHPFVVGADLLYEDRLVPVVVQVLKKTLEPGGTAWIADPGRKPARGFRKRLPGTWHYACFERKTASWEGEVKRIDIHRIRRGTTSGGRR